MQTTKLIYCNQTYLLILIEDADDKMKHFILKLAVFLWLNTN